MHTGLPYSQLFRTARISATLWTGIARREGRVSGLTRSHSSWLLIETHASHADMISSTLTDNSWEQWILRIVVNNTPRPISNDSASVIERQRIQDTAEGMLRSALAKVFEIAGGPIDHVPPVMYEFDISCSKRADDRENVYSRVANMPSILNLTS